MTVRDNSARTQAPLPNVQNEDLTNEPVEAPSNNGLQFVVPTEFVDLPTKGRFYPAGHPLHLKEEIEIKLMTAKEEDMLVNKSLLKKGVALDRMLQSLITTPGVRVDNLCVGDKNALIIASRISAYGSEYNAKVKCPSCGATCDFSFDLEDSIMNTPDTINLADAEATISERGTFVFNLPKTKAVVEARLLTGADEKRLLQASKKNKNEFTITEQFNAFIVSINGVEDRNLIKQYIDVLPAYDSKYLRNNYGKIVPNVDLTQFFECFECGHSQDMEVPFTTDFFWPRS